MNIMGLGPAEFFSALFGIIIVDLVLGGDNAIVIGMACRNLPQNVRMKGVIFGTMGAVVIRIVATLAIVWLLKIDFLMFAGGLLLIFIGIKLMLNSNEKKEISASSSLLRAIFTIIAADAVMGIDNVLSVAGVAQGHYPMVIIGLCISIPIMVLGSTLIMRFMNRFPFIIYIGAGVILYAAAKMITEDPAVEHLFTAPALHYGLIIIVTAGGLLFGYLYNRFHKKNT